MAIVTNPPLIYIAGPFRGPTPLAVRRNVERARDLGLRVAEAGGYPIIPHTMTSEFDKQLTEEFWLTGTMALLARCDAVYMMRTWCQSSSARAEHDWMVQHGRTVLYEIEDGDVKLATWIATWQLGQRLATEYPDV